MDTSKLSSKLKKSATHNSISSSSSETEESDKESLALDNVVDELNIITQDKKPNLQEAQDQKPIDHDKINIEPYSKEDIRDNNSEQTDFRLPPIVNQDRSGISGLNSQNDLMPDNGNPEEILILDISQAKD